MTYEEYNDFCRSLPATSHVIQWGGSDVWKVGGKLFSVGGWNKKADTPAFTFKVSELEYEMLKDQAGFRTCALSGKPWIEVDSVS